MSKLEINIRTRKKITILDISGDLTSGHGAQTLEIKLRKLSIAAKDHVLLNFTKVNTVDAAGMKALVDCWQNFTPGDNHVKLFGFDKHLGKLNVELSTLTHLLTNFDVFDDEAAAIASFDQQDLELTEEPTIRRNKDFSVSPADMVAVDAYIKDSRLEN